MSKQQKQAAWCVGKKKNPCFFCIDSSQHNVSDIQSTAFFFSWDFSNNEAMPCILLFSSFT